MIKKNTKGQYVIGDSYVIISNVRFIVAMLIAGISMMIIGGWLFNQYIDIVIKYSN